VVADALKPQAQITADVRKVFAAMRALRPEYTTKRRIELLSGLSPQRTATILTLMMADNKILFHQGCVQGRDNTYSIIPGHNRRG
jgi:hypothetical protein